MNKKVSVIIPTRNEAQFIEETLKSVLNQDYPSQFLEIIVVDGESDDNTCDLVNEIIQKNPNIILINNPERVVPYALNYAVKRAIGDFIVRMDSHSVYPANYISSLIFESVKLNAENVGARVVTHPSNSGIIATSIAEAISHPLGVGNSSFRLAGNKAMEVDTVPFGCFPKTIFDEIGMFDTDLIRNQDDEFNGRIIKNGGKIYLVPNLAIEYYTRGTISKMMKMFYHYGLFKPLVNKKLGSAATIRQFVPPAFILYLCSGVLMSFGGEGFQFLWALGLLIYLILDFIISISIALKKKKMKLVLILPLIFLLIHLSYGYGYLKGWVMINALGRNPGEQNFATSR